MAGGQGIVCMRPMLACQAMGRRRRAEAVISEAAAVDASGWRARL